MTFSGLKSRWAIPLLALVLPGCYQAHASPCVPASDVVFVFDVSGSMEPYFDAAAIATIEHVEALDPETRVALVIVGLHLEPGYLVAVDFVEPRRFVAALSYYEVTGTWPEPTLDALFAIGSGALPLSWRAGPRRVVVFSDEHEPGEHSSSDACAALEHAERLQVFVSSEELGSYPCADARVIERDSEAMLEALDDACR